MTNNLIKTVILLILFIAPFFCSPINSIVIPITGILILTLFCLFLIYNLALKQKKINELINTDLFNASILVYFVGFCFSSLTSQNILSSVNEAFKLSCTILFFLMMRFYSREYSFKKNAMNALLLGGLFVCIYGLYQNFIGFKDSLEYFMKLKSNLSERETSEIIGNLKSMRIFSVFIYPNTLAGYLIIIIPVSFVSIYANSKKIVKNLMILLTILLLIVLFMTKSIGGWVVLLASIFMIYIMQKGIFKDNSIKLTLAALSAVFGSIVILRYNSLFNFSSEQGSIAGRLQFWELTLKIIKDNFLLGTGPGTFGSVQKTYSGLHVNFSHNYYLQLMSETGIIVFIFFSVLIFIILKEGFKNKDLINSGLFAGIFSYLMHNFIDFDGYIWEINLISWAILGLVFNYNLKKTVFMDAISGKNGAKHLIWTAIIISALLFGLRENMFLLLIFSLMLIFSLVLYFNRGKSNAK